ncbi:MAG TPA: carbohydrate porin [Woeseiaceae bacterium]|nr:carbohydrate porin [Woeseiaceae bacterium]
MSIGRRGRRLLAVFVLICSGTAEADNQAVDLLFNVAYAADVLGNVSGGLERGTGYLGNLDLQMRFDAWNASGLDISTVYLYGLYNHGNGFSDNFVGDLQVVSNIEAPNALRLFEAWYEFGTSTWSLRTGLYDLNSEFDVSEAGGYFINSSQGIVPVFSQSGVNGSGIFPVSALAIRAQRRFENLTARVAVLDGVPGNPDDPASNEIDLNQEEGALVVAELDLALHNGGRFWFGYWKYTADFEGTTAQIGQVENDGWYAGLEYEINVAGMAGATFIRMGRGQDELYPLSDYISLGVVLDVLWRDGNEGQLGLAVASAGAGAPYREFLQQSGLASDSRETAFELTYLMRINKFLTLQPNFQYIRNPSMLADRKSAVVIGLRFELAYSR